MRSHRGTTLKCEITSPTFDSILFTEERTAWNCTAAKAEQTLYNKLRAAATVASSQCQSKTAIFFHRRHRRSLFLGSTAPPAPALPPSPAQSPSRSPAARAPIRCHDATNAYLLRSTARPRPPGRPTDRRMADTGCVVGDGGGAREGGTRYDSPPRT